MTSKTKSASASTKKSGGSLDQHPILFKAVEGFVTENDCFGSSIMLEKILDSLKTAHDIKTVFEIPIKKQAFNMEKALEWMLFLSLAPERAEKEGDAPFPGTFEASDALSTIAGIYDNSVQTSVWEHFEQDSDDEEDDDEDADGDDKPSKKKH